MVTSLLRTLDLRVALAKAGGLLLPYWFKSITILQEDLPHGLIVFHVF